MSNDNGKAMTLEQRTIKQLNDYADKKMDRLKDENVHWIAKIIADTYGCSIDLTMVELADAIAAHLATRVTVTNADVERACMIMYPAWKSFHQHEREDFRKDVRAALESFAASLPVATTPDELHSLLARMVDLHDKKQCVLSADMNRVKALLAQGHGGVREGWKWVPVEPTNHQLAAAHNAVVEFQTLYPLPIFEDRRGDQIRTHIYKAMLAAAPNTDGEGNGNG